ncbi:MAG: hypothetical protein ACP5SI_01655 [Chloroflexia bacterium]
MTEESSPERSRRSWTRPLVWMPIAAAVGMVGVLVGLFFLPASVLERVRDVSLVFLATLAASSAILGVLLLLMLLWAIGRLSERVDLLLDQGSEVLERVKGTAGTVKATGDFVGERLVSPFIRVSAWAAGVGEGIRALFRSGKDRGGQP